MSRMSRRPFQNLQPWNAAYSYSPLGNVTVTAIYSKDAPQTAEPSSIFRKARNIENFQQPDLIVYSIARNTMYWLITRWTVSAAMISNGHYADNSLLPKQSVTSLKEMHESSSQQANCKK